MSKNSWSYGNPLFVNPNAAKMRKRIAFLAYANTQQCFELGKAYTVLWRFISRGFTTCLDPLDVLRNSAPAASNFAKVRLAGVVEWPRLTLRWTRMVFLKALSAHDLIEAAIRVRGKSAGCCNTEPYGIASVDAESTAAQSQGECGVAISKGFKGASTNVGSFGAAANTGNGGAATNTGQNGIAVNASFGGGALNTGWSGLAVNDALLGVAASSGCRSLAVNTGVQGVAVNAHEMSEASNNAAEGIAAVLGLGSRARSAAGGIIIVAWWDDVAKRKRVTVGYPDEDGIRSNAWYEADERGALRASTPVRSVATNAVEYATAAQTPPKYSDVPYVDLEEKAMPNKQVAEQAIVEHEAYRTPAAHAAAKGFSD